MATEQAHLRQAQHNEQFLTTFDPAITPYLDWAVTVIFYAALHYIRTNSRAARYDMGVFSSQDVAGLRDEELLRIRQFVLAHL